MVRRLDAIVYLHLVQSHGYSKKQTLGMIFPAPETKDVH